jgi:gliding motility-associated-like protein
MTLPRSLTIGCLCFLLFRMGWAQSQGSLFTSEQLSAAQLVQIDSMASDSVFTALVVPNVFTPNGDGINDFFEVTTDGISVYEFSVFSRTGTRVFYSHSPRIFWDGKNDVGRDMREGIYYYVIEQTDDTEPFEKAGFMHLFR